MFNLLKIPQFFQKICYRILLDVFWFFHYNKKQFKEEVETMRFQRVFCVLNNNYNITKGSAVVFSASRLPALWRRAGVRR